MADEQKTLTTRQGHPVSNNQSLRSVGERGPATLENYQFIEKITHFDRERIPERVVHARGPVVRRRMVISNPMARSATSLPANTPEPRCSPRPAFRRLSSCASPP
ncbi:catalase [Pseudomonas luteola]|uniref:catalase n=1 Tax=Pseudomonas luteola TaxID=47886 RepID=UPI0028A0F341|nr:catalase [Pseudomonas luteola]